MSTVVLSIEWIVADPAIRNGRPIISGTTLRVQDIVAAHNYKQRSPVDLAGDYGLTLAQVHAALAYYYDHQSEIDGQIEQDLKFATEAKEQGIGQRHLSLS